MSLLAVDDVAVAFGGVRAVRGVSLAITAGELVGLIGPNGAGKTTLLRILSGVVRPDAGRVSFAGADVTRHPIHRRARLGLGLTHQIVRPFRDMTLLENVMIAAASTITINPFKALLRRGRGEARERAMALLERLGIADAADKPARVLPLGYLKRLEVARALAFAPRLLMLDEPLAGLNHAEAGKLADLIVALNAEGTTILLVEHNIAEVTRIARRLVVLDNGALLAAGDPAAVMRRQDVRDAYLGRGAAGHA